MVGYPLGWMTGQGRARDLFDDVSHERIPLSRHRLSPGPSLGHDGCHRRPKTGQRCKVFRPGTASRFLTTAVQEWFKIDATPDQERPGALGATEFMRGNRHRIHHLAGPPAGAKTDR